MNQYVATRGGDLEKIKEFFKKEMSTLRTGRANPAILDGVVVEAYSAKSPLNTLANINVSDALSVIVSPWDKNILKEVEKAIVEADLGVGVVNEGDKIRVSVPTLTEENRKELVKKLSAKLEAARIEIRQLRDDIKSKIETAYGAKDIAEDDKFRYIKELDEEIAKRNEELKELKDKKEKEIMTI
jgi:ribosome recycling factor